MCQVDFWLHDPRNRPMSEVHDILTCHGIVEAKRFSATNKSEMTCLDAAHAVMSDEDMDIDIAHAGFAMASLPHRRTKEQVWEREGGPIKLLIESGLDSNKVPVGVPYGAIARMILLYLQTQAVKTRSREVELGSSMNAWLTTMRVPIGGRTYRSVREQASRISRCRLTFFERTATAELVRNGAFVRDAILPLDPSKGGQSSLWQESVRLDEGFYQSLIDHPLPLREAAIQQISGKSMAIDLYLWLAYRLHVLNKPVTVTWGSARTQFGPEYSVVRFFRRDMLPQLQLALAVYPEARIEIDDRTGITLHPSPPPVPQRSPKQHLLSKR